MRVTLTGATGTIGHGLARRLVDRGDEVTALTRDPARAATRLPAGVATVAWDPTAGPAPAEALARRDGVVHLAGENVAQRWSSDAKQRIRASRELGTRNLVAGLRAADPRPAVLVSGSASGYYGSHGDERVDETAPPGDDFLAAVCVAWEREALAAEELGMRVVLVRTGIVLDASGGALAQMLTPFKLGVGGPIAGGRQYMPWIHAEDEVGLLLAALDAEGFSGPVNGSAPEPATNKDFSRALGRALHRPAIAPVPAAAIKLLYGDMSQIVIEGVRMVPGRAGELGYAFRHPDLDEALQSTLSAR
jgi:uncharacterized protein (TIGR01777 family)